MIVVELTGFVAGADLKGPGFKLAGIDPYRKPVEVWYEGPLSRLEQVSRPVVRVGGVLDDRLRAFFVSNEAPGKFSADYGGQTYLTGNWKPKIAQASGQGANQFPTLGEVRTHFNVGEIDALLFAVKSAGGPLDVYLINSNYNHEGIPPLQVEGMAVSLRGFIGGLPSNSARVVLGNSAEAALGIETAIRYANGRYLRMDSQR
ncbi:MAG: hypothetical protein Q7S65_06460 [Nanoarchaeota archaeon]|nr:hypothetical protein [Nanoarchaeota archaeon]